MQFSLRQILLVITAISVLLVFGGYFVPLAVLAGYFGPSLLAKRYLENKYIIWWMFFLLAPPALLVPLILVLSGVDIGLGWSYITFCVCWITVIVGVPTSIIAYLGFQMDYARTALLGVIVNLVVYQVLPLLIISLFWQ